MAITTHVNARKGYSAITTYKLRKLDYLTFIFFLICGSNTRLCVIFISLCFGLYLRLIVSGPHISPHKRPIRVYFSIESVKIKP
jgi:predicted membrane channel-forming protein YqfA (hemolysin III family)